MALAFEFLGWPDEGPTLRLDYRRFAYAGKFVMSSTGKAVAREGGEVVAALAFNADRTDASTCWLRYVTVREDRRGEGIGPRLIAFALSEIDERFDRVKIAVNNPFAYEALYKGGFGFTGEETGIAELVLSRPAPEGRSADRYRDGLDRFRERDLSDAEERFLAERDGWSPPPVEED
ncbi:GNAT family N-acetyltransferase [Natronorarus salvus]|uniref:GNAT family N-acetyltransferase n=1 Tax=Natronorarus salvus TaxID=3117733 RepID=UPI002F267297